MVDEQQIQGIIMEDVLAIAKGVRDKTGDADVVIEQLYDYYIHHTEELPSEFSALILLGETPERAVCDFIACMSDRYMVNLYKELMIPKAWSVLGTEHR